MKLRLSLLIVLSLTLAACAELGEHVLPEKFKSQLVSIRAANIEIDRKTADLQKQIADLQSERQWNCQRANSVANEALNSLNLSGSEYKVDLDTLTIRSVRR